MILKAHVGVGIAGKEGAQAGRSADFAIGQFGFLKKLLFVHGRESERKNGFFLYYMLYKNVAYCMPSVFYAFLSRSSCFDLYDPYLKQVYNTIFTVVPVFAITTFDRELPHYYLFNGPKLYRPARYGGRLGEPFSMQVFWAQYLYANYVAAICIMGCLLLFVSSPQTGGTPMAYHVGVAMYLAIILTVTVNAIPYQSIIFWFTIPGLIVGPLAFIVMWWIGSEYFKQTVVYMSFWVMADPEKALAQFILIVFLVTTVAMLPHLAYAFGGVFAPDSVRLVAERIFLRVHDVLVSTTAKTANAVVVPQKHATIVASKRLSLFKSK